MVAHSPCAPEPLGLSFPSSKPQHCSCAMHSHCPPRDHCPSALCLQYCCKEGRPIPFHCGMHPLHAGGLCCGFAVPESAGLGPKRPALALVAAMLQLNTEHMLVVGLCRGRLGHTRRPGLQLQLTPYAIYSCCHCCAATPLSPLQWVVGLLGIVCCMMLLFVYHWMMDALLQMFLGPVPVDA